MFSSPQARVFLEGRSNILVSQGRSLREGAMFSSPQARVFLVVRGNVLVSQGRSLR